MKHSSRAFKKTFTDPFKDTKKQVLEKVKDYIKAFDHLKLDKLLTKGQFNLKAFRVKVKASTPDKINPDEFKHSLLGYAVFIYSKSHELTANQKSVLNVLIKSGYEVNDLKDCPIPLTSLCVRDISINLLLLEFLLEKGAAPQLKYLFTPEVTFQANLISNKAVTVYF
jgi:hypothetical protein